jgi:hypothetical protein
MTVNSPYAYPYSILGDNITVNTIIAQAQVLNLASVSGHLQVGNKTITESILVPYSYQGSLLNFIGSNYNLTMPTLGSAVTVTVNSIVNLTYSAYPSIHIYRNVSKTFDSYLPRLTQCNGTYTTNAISWKFYNGTSLVAWPTNVMVVGSTNASNNQYRSNNFLTAAAGLSLTAPSNTYVSCMYPSWASFKVYGHLIYNASDTPQSNYYLTGLPIVSSYVQNQILYIAPNATNPLQYVVFVQNAITLSGIPSLVKVLKYNYISGNGILINEVTTTATSGAPLVLDSGMQYIFQAYSLSGNTLMKSEPPFVALSSSSETCSY